MNPKISFTVLDTVLILIQNPQFIEIKNMMSQNYINLTIKSDEITLTALTNEYADDILNGNTGNVRDFFIPFENKKEVEEWIESNF